MVRGSVDVGGMSVRVGRSIRPIWLDAGISSARSSWLEPVPASARSSRQTPGLARPCRPGSIRCAWWTRHSGSRIAPARRRRAGGMSGWSRTLRVIRVGPMRRNAPVPSSLALVAPSRTRPPGCSGWSRNTRWRGRCEPTCSGAGVRLRRHGGTNDGRVWRELRGFRLRRVGWIGEVLRSIRRSSVHACADLPGQRGAGRPRLHLRPRACSWRCSLSVRVLGIEPLIAARAARADARKSEPIGSMNPGRLSRVDRRLPAVGEGGPTIIMNRHPAPTGSVSRPSAVPGPRGPGLWITTA